MIAYLLPFKYIMHTHLLNNLCGFVFWDTLYTPFWISVGVLGFLNKVLPTYLSTPSPHYQHRGHTTNTVATLPTTSPHYKQRRHPTNTVATQPTTSPHYQHRRHTNQHRRHTTNTERFDCAQRGLTVKRDLTVKRSRLCETDSNKSRCIEKKTYLD